MAYEKQTWVDGVTVVTAKHMKHIEDGIVDIDERLAGLETSSDEHINELINAALGVIENGTY